MLDRLLELSPNLGLDTLLLLLILIGLETVLSADNAIALASLVQGLDDVKLERLALNWGLVAAFVMRMGLIFGATWVIRFWQFELLGALYLLWLALDYFVLSDDEDNHSHGRHFTSIWQAIPLIAITDLAFSLDSVTTAIALSDERWLIITGGVIGIIALRFLAELFIRWLQEFVYLQDAGYVTVTFVGFRLLLKVVNDQWVPPEWITAVAIGLIFVWGFSKRVDPPISQALEAEASPDLPQEPVQAEIKVGPKS
ncbi:DUF475 domain-containing protein [Synechococcales cyanobacterium C]|uniref:DUF475 domain-containing protein n=1 Tax=Petrachloros mirabilis ULC683 TaxID=2781853 RepID=A0A8K2A0S9_9CYAN|nr:DUF475 domain-containing protein [Petrachloros mirabilis]NCJ07282.1 DUF475 domain-containing protein [Petrachloros mirabilis ULC683]